MLMVTPKNKFKAITITNNIVAYPINDNKKCRVLERECLTNGMLSMIDFSLNNEREIKKNIIAKKSINPDGTMCSPLNKEDKA